MVRSDAYPGWSQAAGQDMVDATRDFVTWVAFDGSGRFEDLLVLEDVQEPERLGVMGQRSVLTATSHSDQTSPIRRGLWVREQLLCQTFPVPPADVGPVPEIDPDATTRERFAQHTEDPFCAGCHELIDPVGFGLEAYDAVGAFRAEENGQPIDTTGELLGLEDLYDEQAWSFEGLPGLADILAASTSARRCYVTQSWRFATGRLEEPEDACTLGALDASFEAADGDLRELLVQWAASPEVALRRTP